MLAERRQESALSGLADIHYMKHGSVLAKPVSDHSLPTHPCAEFKFILGRFLHILFPQGCGHNEQQSEQSVMVGGHTCKLSCLRLRQGGHKLEACLSEGSPVSASKTVRVKLQHRHHGVTYVYFRMPSSFEVQIMMLLSADPDAKRLPGRFLKRKIITCTLNQHFPDSMSKKINSSKHLIR